MVVSSELNCWIVIPTAVPIRDVRKTVGIPIRSVRKTAAIRAAVVCAAAAGVIGSGLGVGWSRFEVWLDGDSDAAEKLEPRVEGAASGGGVEEVYEGEAAQDAGHKIANDVHVDDHAVGGKVRMQRGFVHGSISIESYVNAVAANADAAAIAGAAAAAGVAAKNAAAAGVAANAAAALDADSRDFHFLSRSGFIDHDGPQRRKTWRNCLFGGCGGGGCGCGCGCSGGDVVVVVTSDTTGVVERRGQRVHTRNVGALRGGCNGCPFSGNV